MIEQLKCNLASLLDTFFRRHLVAQRRASPATVSSYRDALRLFLLFASERARKPPSRLSLEELDRDVVLAFLDHLEQERHNSVSTRNVRLNAIRSFFQHVAYCEPAAMSLANRVLSIQSKKTTKRLVGYLRQTELHALLAAPDQKTPQGRRDYALMLFLARTGGRVSETIGVNVGDLRLQQPSDVLFRGKGSKERNVPLAKDIAAVLRAFIQERRITTDLQTPVFVNARGKRLTRHGVVHIIHRAVVIAARTDPPITSKAISPHSLRHTAAMKLLQSGVDLTTIQSWLGHASVNTTHQYVEADLDMKRRALEKCNMSEAKLVTYRPTDKVLALLEAL
jgi:site-specific recombinase XerD